jgi:hypothetical protein
VTRITQCALDPQGDWLAWDSLLPSQNPHTQVCVRSVFYPARWIYRALSSNELARVYDIPSALIQPLIGLFPRGATGLPFLNAALAKVLHSVGVMMFDHNLKRGSGSTVVSENKTKIPLQVHSLRQQHN